MQLRQRQSQEPRSMQRAAGPLEWVQCIWVITHYSGILGREIKEIKHLHWTVMC